MDTSCSSCCFVTLLLQYMDVPLFPHGFLATRQGIALQFLECAFHTTTQMNHTIQPLDACRGRCTPTKCTKCTMYQTCAKTVFSCFGGFRGPLRRSQQRCSILQQPLSVFGGLLRGRSRDFSCAEENALKEVQLPYTIAKLTRYGARVLLQTA